VPLMFPMKCSRSLAPRPFFPFFCFFFLFSFFFFIFLFFFFFCMQNRGIERG